MERRTRWLLRWGVWVCYSELRPDQPHEDWSGRLAVEGGRVHNPRYLLYHGCFGPQHRVALELPQLSWTSPRLDLERPVFGYKGLEGLLLDIEGDGDTEVRFETAMLSASFRLGDVPAGGWPWPPPPVRPARWAASARHWLPPAKRNRNCSGLRAGWCAAWPFSASRWRWPWC
jgi:hypothetical protein